jgi:hypothetical protein
LRLAYQREPCRLTVANKTLARGPKHRLAGVAVEVCDRAEQSAQPAGVVVHADHADGGQGHAAGVSLTDPDREGAVLALLVAEPEAVATPPLVLAPREAHRAATTRAGLAAAVCGKCPAKVDRGLLEHLRGDLVPPR